MRDEILDFVTERGGEAEAGIVASLLREIDGVKYELLHDLTVSLRNEYLRGHTDGYAKAVKEMDGEA